MIVSPSKAFLKLSRANRDYTVRLSARLVDRFLAIHGGGLTVSEIISMFANDLATNAIQGRVIRKSQGLDAVDLFYINEQRKACESILDFKQKQKDAGQIPGECRAYE